MLDLAETVGRRVQVAIVDDGSADGTYEAACELSREFPQVVVLRQPFQHGLGPALEQVRIRLGVRHVVAHDGVAPIDFEELAQMLVSADLECPPLYASLWEADREGRGSRRLAGTGTLSCQALPPQRALGAFRWLRLDEPTSPRRRRATPVPLTSGLAGGRAGSSTFNASVAGTL
jgi:hypothetical protein